MTAEWLTMVIDAGVKATVVLVLAGLLALTLRRASAATRHFVWTLALGSLLALPALTHLVPTWHVPVSSDSVVRLILARETRDQESPVEEVPARASDSIESTAPDQTDPPLESNDKADVDAEAILREAVSDSSSAPVAPSTSPLSFGSLLLLVWAIGAGLVLARLAAGSIAIRWIARRTMPIDDPAWRDLCDIVVAQVGVTCSPELRQGRKAATPMTWGLWRPVVLLPPAAQSWSEERRRVVLLHEVAHVKRRDCLTQTLGHLACAFYWFNPLVWIAAARLHAERERACDDLVLSSGTQAAEYARHLLEIARSLRASGPPAWATVSMARRTQLEGRLLAILDPALSRHRITTVRRALGVAGVLCIVLPLAGLRAADASSELVVDISLGEWERQSAPADGPSSSSLPEPQPATTARATQGATPRPTPAPAPREPSRPPVKVDEVEIERAIDDAMEQGTPAIAGLDRHAITESVRDALHHLETNDAPDGVSQIDYEDLVASALATRRQSRSAAGTDRRTNDQAVQALAGALKDQDVSVRRQAALALGELGNRLAVPGLLQALSDSDAGVRQAAVSALGDLRDERSVEPLTNALKDADPGVRRRAVSALEDIGDPRAIPGLIEASRVEDSEIRRRAVSALSEFEDPRAVEPLIAAAKDPDAEVREQAVSALGEIQDPRAVPVLAAAISDSDHEVRQRAVSALGEIRDARAVEPLIAALKDPDVEIRQRAASALGELRDASAVEPLIAAMKDADPGVRRRAASSLSEVRDSRAVPALLEALKDENPSTRQRAVSALSELRDERAVDPLMTALKDPDAGVRMRAASALGEIRDARAVDALTAALSDQDPNVRRRAVAALRELGVEER